jgi:hypothetical protein
MVARRTQLAPAELEAWWLEKVAGKGQGARDAVSCVWLQEKEDRLVECDMSALEARRLRAALEARAREVIGMENGKAQLERGRDQRRREIQVHIVAVGVPSCVGGALH